MDAHTTPEPRRRSRRTRLLALATAGALTLGGLSALVPGSPAGAALPAAPYLVSRSATGDAWGGLYGSLSGDGRFVAFTSSATSLVPGDTNGKDDVFVKDRWSGAVERVSVSTSEAQGNNTSTNAVISDDGRYVAFLTLASNLVPGDTKGFADIVLRDRVLGTTTRVSRGTGGAEVTGNALGAEISGNGRFVAWHSVAANVVAGDTNAKTDVFVWDRVTGTNERVSISALEGQSLEDSSTPAISDDGRYVAFVSGEELAGGSVTRVDAFVRDRTAGTTILVSVPVSGEIDANVSSGVRISGNGRYVAFRSGATNLVASDTNGSDDIFRRDLQTATTTIVTRHDNDAQLVGAHLLNDITDDGNQVLFSTTSPATSAPDAGGDTDAFVRTISTASTKRISTSPSFPDPVGVSPGHSLSDKGDAAAFYTSAPLVDDHSGPGNQVYVHESLLISYLLGSTDLIQQQYQDFLGRAATPAELLARQDEIRRGELHPAQLISQLALTPSFATDRAAVVRLYWAFFLRRPDAAGLTHWITQRQAGTSLASIAQSFAGSKEFKDRYGTLTDQQFVSLVYVNVFERQPDAPGLAYWTDQLATGKRTRGTVLVGFSESAEGKTLLAPQAHATLISLGMLRTPPSKAFWDQVLAAYDAGETQIAWVAQTMLLSNAYASRLD